MLVEVFAGQDGMKDPVLIGTKVSQAQLAVDALRLDRSVVGDEVHKVRALQVGACDLVALHHCQIQVTEIRGRDSLFWRAAVAMSLIASGYSRVSLQHEL